MATYHQFFRIKILLIIPVVCQCFIFSILGQVAFSQEISHYPVDYESTRSSYDYYYPTLPSSSFSAILGNGLNEWGFGRRGLINRERRHALNPDYDRDLSNGDSISKTKFRSKVQGQFTQEWDEYHQRQGGFLPPSACPGRRSYIFYCHPRDTTGPLNPAIGQPWSSNGVYFQPPHKQTTLAPPPPTSTTAKVKSNRLLLRPPCDSILCPVGGNEGYGYTGIEDSIGKKQHDNIDNKKCATLLCFSLSKIKK